MLESIPKILVKDIFSVTVTLMLSISLVPLLVSECKLLAKETSDAFIILRRRKLKCLDGLLGANGV